jgi:uncharacterized protein YjbI with pentapeptide repeats
VTRRPDRPLLHDDLAETFGRLIETALGDPNVAFRKLAEAAGLNPARDFVGASLVDVDFRDEDLRGFNFARADLTGADFRRANVEGVSFDGAILTNVIGLPVSGPPSDFDPDEVKRMVLAGIAPPRAWMPSIRELKFADEALADLSPLAGLSGLQHLDLDGTPVSDVSALAGLSGLQHLGLSDTPVSDVSALAGLSGLQRLYLNSTQVSDLSPLAGLSGLQYSILRALRSATYRRWPG